MDQSILNEIFSLGVDLSFPMIIILGMIITFGGAYIGSISGLGGGMIIKPLYGSLLGMISVVGVLTSKIASSVVVFGNSASTLGTQLKSGTKVNFRIGSVIGVGVIGGIILVRYLPEVSYGMETLLQGILYFLVFFTVLFRDKMKVYHLSNNNLAIFIIGIIIGLISAFFGIGGGAIKVPFLLIFLGMNMKEAALYSFLIAMISEPVKVFEYSNHLLHVPGVSPDVLQVAFIFGVCMIPPAILGGYFGAKTSKNLTSEQVALFFNSIIIYFAIISLISGVLLVSGIRPESEGSLSIVRMIVQIFTGN